MLVDVGCVTFVVRVGGSVVLQGIALLVCACECGICGAKCILMGSIVFL